MATEVGTGYVTIYSKMSPDFDKPISNKVKASGHSAGSTFGGTFSVTAGNLLSSGISKALGAITAHMDSAIGRVDALNQFPKVMANIGFSSDDASAAIQKMSDGIQGLPTTLDDIVGNAQRLALSLGDLGKASDVAIALNDGFLMFGASSADVSNAITQLNQMVTAGKYDMQSWNSINQAAPGFLDTVARSMLGTSSNANELREALNKGTVSTDDFLGAIVNLDQNGADGITSFSEGVKSATGGIETSLGRIDSAITRNLANFVNLAANTLGFTDACNVAVNVINLIGSTINGWFTDAIANATPFVETLMESINSFMETAAPLGPVVQDIANAIGIILQAAIIGIIFVINTLVNIVSGIISVFTNFSGVCVKAQGVMNSFASVVHGAFASLGNFVSGAIGAAVGAISGFVGTVAGAASNLADTIVNALSSLPGKALQWGSDIVNSIADGIRNAIGAVAGAASNIASTIASYLHFSEPDIGPLSNFHTFMPDMMQLMADGIRGNIGLVRDEIDNVASMVADGMTLNASVNATGGTTNGDVVRAINTLHGDLYGIIKDATPDGISGRQFGRLVNRYA